MKNKIKIVKIEGKTGDFTFTYKPVPTNESSSLICEEYCQYNQICNKLKDPRDINNPETTFADFCGELGIDDDNEDLLDYVPINLEESFKDCPDIFNQLIEKDPVVRLKKIISCVCSGWCSDFSEDFSKCNSKNKSCILHDLFLKNE